MCMDSDYFLAFLACMHSWKQQSMLSATWTLEMYFMCMQASSHAKPVGIDYIQG
jgi:hypothetical protein